ncbi:hypothetical protein Dimus_003229 [Dionaea muscipula]
MAPRSLSLLSPMPSTSSAAATSIITADSLLYTSRHRHSRGRRLVYSSSPRQNPRFPKPRSVSFAPRACDSVGSSLSKDGSADQFLRSKSIADFMRFKRGTDAEAEAELQTAVVSYRKKFPWSLLQPFLRVDLVSTIHIGDKE